MQSDQNHSAGNGRPSAPQRPDSSSELDRLRARCRRQAQAIDALSDAVNGLRRGARALKAENAELRGDSERVRRQRRAGERVNGHVDSGERIEARLMLGVQAPGAARRVVADCLGDRVATSVFHNAQLLMSELVTNSVRHSGMPAGAELVVSVALTPGMVRLDVEDPGRGGTIAPHPPDSHNGSGFGLNLVQALSERWGMERVAEGGTRVWAQLARAPRTAPARSDGRREAIA
jgi:anti-sigma regulatory factor (Ser/Thr protein kinase)